VAAATLAAAADAARWLGRAVATASAIARAGAVYDCLSVAGCYTPQQIRVAYGIQPLLDRGIDGRGQTVVLLEFTPLPLFPARIRHPRGPGTV
jgi:subtilase family serine protease